MRLKDGAFKTDVKEGMFCISIRQESDLSVDGGHSFEDVTNTWALNQQTAMDLLGELKEYLSNT